MQPLSEIKAVNAMHRIIQMALNRFVVNPLPFVTLLSLYNSVLTRIDNDDASRIGSIKGNQGQAAW